MMNVEVQRSSGKREFTGRRSGGVKVVVFTILAHPRSRIFVSQP